MGYYNEPVKTVDVQEYTNKFGQVIKIGDHVYWPTWCAGISEGDVARIIEKTFVIPEWNWAVRDPNTGRAMQIGSHEEIKYNLRVQKKHSKPTIYKAQRVFKLEGK